MRIYQSLARTAATLVLLTATLAAQAQEGNMDTILDIHHILGYLVAAFLISVFVMIFTNRLIYYREQGVIMQAQQLNAQLGLILDTNKTEAWTFDLKQRLYKVLSEMGSKETTYTPIQFSQRFDRDEFLAMLDIITAIEEGRETTGSIVMRSAPSKGSAEGQRIYEVSLSILRRDRHNSPTILLGTQHDITEESRKAEETRNLMLRYHTVFNSSLIDMIYYNADGIMTDINNKACESFAVEDREALLQARASITDVPAMKGIDFQTMDRFYTSSITQLEHIDTPIGELEEGYWGNKIYYEQTMTPIRDQSGKLTGIVMAGRNITDMVNSQHHQKYASQLLEKRTNDIQQYIQNINYSLRISDARLMTYNPNTHELEISSDLSRTQYRLSQVRAVSLINDRDRRKAKGLLHRMDRRHEGVITETLQTIMRDKEGRDVYLNFNVTPIRDKDGRVSHYFGMCRNETEATYLEHQLQKETEKAQDAEQVKNTFLLNMSYELRTPLSAVIGFAELFNNEHSPEDEPIFAEEIKKNTGILLQLINDILFLSRLDARMIEYNYEENDFAQLFDGWCYMGWSSLSPGVKAVVENPYNSLVARIDQQNLGMVIQKLCTYSGLTTSEGIVRAKYEYRRGELMITIEDTGRGVSAEVLPRAFDRFVHEEGVDMTGTGLDLPIVKELIEQMNGVIELQSENGKGSTFLISIPCKLISLERKAEILI